MYRKINQRLRELLLTKDWSVAEFAEMADLPIETVKNIYYGRSEDPKISTVVKMAGALGISLNDLMSIDEHNDVEKEIIANYRMCGEHGKGIIAMVAKYEATSVKTERNLKN